MPVRQMPTLLATAALKADALRCWEERTKLIVPRSDTSSVMDLESIGESPRMQMDKTTLEDTSVPLGTSSLSRLSRISSACLSRDQSDRMLPRGSVGLGKVASLLEARFSELLTLAADSLQANQTSSSASSNLRNSRRPSIQIVEDDSDLLPPDAISELESVVGEFMNRVTTCSAFVGSAFATPLPSAYPDTKASSFDFPTTSQSDQLAEMERLKDAMEAQLQTWNGDLLKLQQVQERELNLLRENERLRSELQHREFTAHDTDLTVQKMEQQLKSVEELDAEIKQLHECLSTQAIVQNPYLEQEGLPEDTDERTETLVAKKYVANAQDSVIVPGAVLKRLYKLYVLLGTVSPMLGPWQSYTLAGSVLIPVSPQGCTVHSRRPSYAGQRTVMMATPAVPVRRQQSVS